MTVNTTMAGDWAAINRPSVASLGASITQAASRQTYYTIRYLVDRDLVQDAYRAYAYFRWLDDQLDQGGMDRSARLAFIQRQGTIIDGCYRGTPPQHPTPEETLLVDLLNGRQDGNSGLQTYIRDMLEVMRFDAGRQGRLISAGELSQYTHLLAVAVTEAMHYFIGHNCRSPHTDIRYLAVSAAHVTHMLRDTLEDVRMGYFNIPREWVEAHHIDPCDIHCEAYRDWIRKRVELARAWFRCGREYLAQVQNPRCRLAGIAYSCRFTGLLDTIEGDDYHLRPNYSESRTLTSGISNGWTLLTQFLQRPSQTLHASLGD